MNIKNLKNKPLIEAIFELKWLLQEPIEGVNLKIDPHYKLLIGRVYDRVKEEYPFHEQLTASNIPEEFAAYVVQHRFRKKEKGWPLNQIGPGIITLNDTSNYTWDDFKRRIKLLLDTLFESYPEANTALKINNLLLRYIDAIEFDFSKNEIFAFLKDHMKMNIGIYDKLFENTGINKLSPGFDIRFSFPSTKPKGLINLRFTRGEKNGKDALIWETMVQTDGINSPQKKTDISKWVEKAHTLTDDWFFKIIEGDLFRRFE